MAGNTGKKSIFNFLKIKENDEDFEEDYNDLFGDEDDDEDYSNSRTTQRKRNSTSSMSRNIDRNTQNNQSNYTPRTSKPMEQQKFSNTSQVPQKNNEFGTNFEKPKTTQTQNSKLVAFNNQKSNSGYGSLGDVIVIRPQEFDDAQMIADSLRNGRMIVINMEGGELETAQRIIDFIGGASYALGGSIQAISANIFIAVPNSIEVSGDLRDEIINENILSPQLGRY